MNDSSLFVGKKRTERFCVDRGTMLDCGYVAVKTDDLASAQGVKLDYFCVFIQWIIFVNIVEESVE